MDKVLKQILFFNYINGYINSKQFMIDTLKFLNNVKIYVSYWG